MSFEYEYKNSGNYELDAYNYYDEEDYDGEKDIVCELVMYKGHHPIIMPPETYEGLKTVTIERDRTMVAHEDVEYMIWLKKCDFGMRFILESMKMENSMFKDEMNHTDYMCFILQRGMEGFQESRERIVSSLVSHNIVIDYEIAKEVLTKIVKNDKRRLKDEELNVYVYELGPYSVGIRIRMWTSVDDYWPVYNELSEKINLCLANP